MPAACSSLISSYLIIRYVLYQVSIANVCFFNVKCRLLIIKIFLFNFMMKKLASVIKKSIPDVFLVMIKNNYKYIKAGC